MRPMSRTWLVGSRAEALPGGERQRFKKTRTIQPRAAEETGPAPERSAGSPCCFPGSIPLLFVFPRREEEDNSTLLTAVHLVRLRHPGFAPNNSSCSQASSGEFPWPRWGQAHSVVFIPTAPLAAGSLMPRTCSLGLERRQGRAAS